MADPALTRWAVAHARTVGRSGTVARPASSIADLSLVEAHTWMTEDRVIRSMAWQLTEEGARLAFADGTMVAVLDGMTGVVLASWRPRPDSMLCWVGNQLLGATADLLLHYSADVRSNSWNTESWNAESGSADIEAGIMAIAYEPDGGLLATGDGNAVRTWQPHALRGWSPIQTFTGHRDWVTSVAWKDRRVLASGSADGTVRLWDVLDGRLVQSVSHGSWVSSVAFAELPSGQQLMATVANDGSAKVWEPASGELIHTLEGQLMKLSSAMWTVLPDGRALLAAGGLTGTVRVWDGRTGQVVTETPDLGGLLHSVLWGRTPDGQVVLAAAGAATGIRVFRLTRPKERSAVPSVESIQVAGSEPNRLLTTSQPPVVLPRGLVATAYSGGEVALTSLETGDVRCTLTGHGGWVRTMDWQIDAAGRFIVATGDSRGYVRVWDAETGHPITAFHTHPVPVRSIALAVSPQGPIYVAVCGGSSVETWIEASRVRRIRYPQVTGRGLVNSVAWGRPPSGRLLLAAGFGNFGVLLDDDGNQVIEVPTPGSANAADVTIRPDGMAMLAVATSAGSIHVWDERTNQVTIYDAGSDALTTVSWAALPDGRLLLAAGSESGTITIWNGLDGKRVEALETGLSALRTTRWLIEPDGLRLTASGFGGTVRLDVTLYPPLAAIAEAPREASPPPVAGHRPPAHAILGLLKLGAGNLWPALGLVSDLLDLTGGRSSGRTADRTGGGSGGLYDPRLKPLESHPGIARLQNLGWPTAARIAFVALLTADLPENRAYQPPVADLMDIHAALTQAVDTEPLEPAVTGVDPDQLGSAVSAIDEKTTMLLSIIGPAAAAEEPLLALRMRHHAASLPALTERQLRLLASSPHQPDRQPRRSGGTPRHTPGTAGVVRHGPLSHMLHTDLALPAELISLRRIENELLYRHHTAPQPPLPRPLALVLDTTPPTYGPAEQVLRLAAHVLTIASWQFGLQPVLITLGDPEHQVPLAGLRELMLLWTTRTLAPPASVLDKALGTAAHTGRATVLLAHQHTPGQRQLPGPACPFVTVRHPPEPLRRHLAHPDWHDLSPGPRETELAALVNAVLLRGRSS
jgi:WD40 repeat protein